MNLINNDYIEEYLKTLSNYPNSSVMNEMISHAKANMIPILRPTAVTFINVMVKILKPQTVLEIGTSIGYSSIVIMKAMRDIFELTGAPETIRAHEAIGTQESQATGKLITIENNEERVNTAKEYFRREGLENQISIINGDAGEILHYMESKFDLIFMDGPKGQYINYLPDCIRLLNDEGLLICDDVLYYGAVAGNELVKRKNITIVNRMREFLDVITNHPQLNTAVVPIGDGISVSHKRR